MFKEIIEETIKKENLEAKEKLTRKVNKLESLLREIGMKWEDQNNPNAVYYLYKNPQTQSISLQIGDIRFNESFCTIIQSTIKDNNVYAYVSPEDLIEEVLEVVEDNDDKETSLTIKTITDNLQSPIKDVINAVKRSTEKSREKELAEKQLKKEVETTSSNEKVEKTQVTKKDDEHVPLKDISSSIFSKTKALISCHTTLEDLGILIHNKENTLKIERVIKFLLKDNVNTHISSEAMSGIDRGYVKIKNETALEIFKNMNNPSTTVEGFIKFKNDYCIYNIGNIMFKVISSVSEPEKFISQKSETYSKNCFR